MRAGTKEWRGFSTLKKDVEKALEPPFPGVIEVTQGHGGYANVLVVSTALNKLPEQQKQAAVWRVLHDQLGEKAQRVSCVIAYGTDELR